jgi:Protein of unknown function (DUF2961)
MPTLNVDHPVLTQHSSHLFRATSAVSRRASSWDRTGRNRDYLTVQPNETVVLMEHDGPGCVTHFYAAMILPDITDYRDAIVRCYWDRSPIPSVEVPLGDFFGVSHARIREVSSQMMAVNPGYGTSHGLNCYFPMPFAEHARITLEHRGERALGGALSALWYHVDYEVYDADLPSDTLRFHAHYRQERPTKAIGDEPNQTLHDAVNLDGRENYVALDTRGRGQMVGLHLQVHNQAGGWYGEGDDMAFIDGVEWPPNIHGTGTEEIFGGGACPNVEYASTYTGFHLVESPSFDGLIGMYRWYVSDPIRFTESLRWTLEHGHANNFGNGYSSVAYWYQDPVAAEFPALPSRADLLPPLPDNYADLRDRFFAATKKAREDNLEEARRRLVDAGKAFYKGDWAAVERELEALAS